jgi:hypothetical protein
MRRRPWWNKLKQAKRDPLDDPPASMQEACETLDALAMVFERADLGRAARRLRAVTQYIRETQSSVVRVEE